MRSHLRIIRSAARDLLFNFSAAALCKLGLVAGLSLRAQAQEAVPLARGNTPGEPHHRLKIENEYVRVYYVEAPPHEATQLHQHDDDYLYVSLGPADVVSAVRDKPEVHLILKDGEVHFTRGGFAHVARNLSDAPFRNVTIEFLHPQDHLQNLCERVIDGPVKNCSPEFGKLPADSPLRTLPTLGIIPRGVFETDEIDVASYSLSLVGDYKEDSKNSRLLVAEDGPTVNVEISGEPLKSLKCGDVVWIEAGKNWRIILPRGNTPTRFIAVRFKDTNPVASPSAKP